MQLGSPTTAYLLVIVPALATSYVLALFIGASAQTLQEALVIGFLAWLGFTAATAIGDYTFLSRGWALGSKPS